MADKVRMIPIPVGDEGSRNSMLLLCHPFSFSLAVF